MARVEMRAVFAQQASGSWHLFQLPDQQDDQCDRNVQNAKMNASSLQSLQAQQERFHPLKNQPEGRNRPRLGFMNLTLLNREKTIHFRAILWLRLHHCVEKIRNRLHE